MKGSLAWEVSSKQGKEGMRRVSGQMGSTALGREAQAEYDRHPCVQATQHGDPKQVRSTCVGGEGECQSQREGSYGEAACHRYWGAELCPPKIN